MLDVVKELLLKDIAEHIPFMIGAVGGKTPKLNVTRLSEVFIPFGVIFYFLFGMMEDVKSINTRITAMEITQTVSASQIKDLKENVGAITHAIQNAGFARFIE